MEDIIGNNKIMNNKRVLWVNPSFLDYRIPLYAELKKAYNDNFYLIYSKKRIPERCHSKIIKILYSNALFLEKEKYIKFNYSYTYANTGVRIPLPIGLYKQIKKAKPNVIIAEGFFQFTPWAVWYSFIHHIPLLIAYERTAHTERNCPWWRRLYRRFIGLFVNGYIANGELTKEYLISQGVKPQNIFTGAMCADSKGLSKQVAEMSVKEKDDIKQRLVGKDIKGHVYIYVGRIIVLKGINYLLDAWKIHIKDYPNDKLLIVGDGPLLEEYKVSFKHPSIIFTGAIDYSQIYKYYAVSDVFIIPTLEDNWSLVVPEAMACGLPIACSIYNGCYPELVKEDINGRTFDPLNKKSIIDTLSYFHQQDLEKMGKKSIEIESEFNPENTANNIIKAVTQIYNS